MSPLSAYFLSHFVFNSVLLDDVLSPSSPMCRRRKTFEAIYKNGTDRRSQAQTHTCLQARERQLAFSRHSLRLCNALAIKQRELRGTGRQIHKSLTLRSHQTKGFGYLGAGNSAVGFMAGKRSTCQDVKAKSAGSRASDLFDVVGISHKHDEAVDAETPTTGGRKTILHENR
eukprot:765398-Hanusia_phi.AAC.4